MSLDHECIVQRNEIKFFLTFFGVFLKCFMKMLTIIGEMGNFIASRSLFIELVVVREVYCQAVLN